MYRLVIYGLAILTLSAAKGKDPFAHPGKGLFGFASDCRGFASDGRSYADFSKLKSL